MVGVPPEQREGQLKAKIEDKINARGSSDERASPSTGQVADRVVAVGCWIIYACFLDQRP